MMYKKVMVSALLWAALTASAGAFDYNQSVDEIAERVENIAKRNSGIVGLSVVEFRAHAGTNIVSL